MADEYTDEKMTSQDANKQMTGKEADTGDQSHLSEADKAAIIAKKNAAADAEHGGKGGEGN